MKLSAYRLVNLRNGRYPAWVSLIAGKSGVYVIRSLRGERILYVGESHTGRLRKTLLRHFQAWTGVTAGVIYNRATIEVAVCIERKDRAQKRQGDLIQRLKPRDNSNA